MLQNSKDTRNKDTSNKDIVKMIDDYIIRCDINKEDDFALFTTYRLLTKQNARIRNNNLYALDKYGLPVRFNEKNKHTNFGWRLTSNNEIVNNNVEQELIDSNNQDIFNIVKQKLLKKNRTANSTVRKIFDSLDNNDI